MFIFMTYLFAAVGLAVAGYGVVTTVQGRALLSWPTCRGRVTRSSITTHLSSDMDTSLPTTMYKADITYAYEAGGGTHEGTMDCWSSSTPTGAMLTVARNPVGTPVTVYYSPAHPEISTLDRWGQVKHGLGITTFALLFTGIAYVLHAFAS